MKSTATKYSALAFAVSLLLGVSATAQTVSYSDYRSGKAQIKADYKAEKKSCAALTDNAKDICEEQAEGKEDVAQAELYERYKPSLKSHYKVQVAKAEAIYEVAKERCDNLDDDSEDICVTEAKAALTTAKANATVEMKTQADKQAAQYIADKEKCDAYAATAKDNCLRDAQANYGKL